MYSLARGEDVSSVARWVAWRTASFIPIGPDAPSATPGTRYIWPPGPLAPLLQPMGGVGADSRWREANRAVDQYMHRLRLPGRSRWSLPRMQPRASPRGGWHLLAPPSRTRGTRPPDRSCAMGVRRPGVRDVRVAAVGGRGEAGALSQPACRDGWIASRECVCVDVKREIRRRTWGRGMTGAALCSGLHQDSPTWPLRTTHRARRANRRWSSRQPSGL